MEKPQPTPSDMIPHDTPTPPTWLRWSRCLLAFLLAPVCLSHLQAQVEEEEVPGADLMIQVEYLKIDHATLTELFLNRKMKADATELRMEMTKLIQQGKAEIAETAIITTPSGQRAKTEAVAEIISPVEWALPEGLQADRDEEPGTAAEDSTGTQADPSPAASSEVDAPDDSTGVPAVGDRVPNEKGSTAAEDGEKLDQASTSKHWPPAMFPTPSAFEVRNVGFVLEVDPMLAETPGYIDINLAPELVSYDGDKVVHSVATPEGKQVDTMKLPMFSTARLQTSRTVKDGAYAFLGSISAVDENSGLNPRKKYLVFLRVCILGGPVGRERPAPGREPGPGPEPDPFE